VAAGRVTSKDVAAAAGVSRATVSYVLNGVERQRISPATRARVLAAAERLGYVPHAAASALRAGRTTIVLLALPDWPLGPPMADAVSTAVGELERLGYTPLVHFTPRAGGGAALARAATRVQPVGVIAPGWALPPVDALRRAGVAAIVALGAKPLDDVPTFSFDQGAIGRIAVGHLAGRGHRSVLVLLPDDERVSELASDRLAGAEAEATARGVAVASLRVALADIPARLPAALGAPPAPTAIFAFNDEHALAAMAALADAGIAVPADVALIGCDDSLAARHARPRLTTINLVAAETWRELARRLHDLVEGRAAAHLDAAPRLVPGDTT
jgi:DNA-binding LacI/PurR family transcriptional regulator